MVTTRKLPRTLLVASLLALLVPPGCSSRKRPKSAAPPTPAESPKTQPKTDAGQPATKEVQATPVEPDVAKPAAKDVAVAPKAVEPDATGAAPEASASEAGDLASGAAFQEQNFWVYREIRPRRPDSQDEGEAIDRYQLRRLVKREQDEAGHTLITIEARGGNTRRVRTFRYGLGGHCMARVVERQEYAMGCAGPGSEAETLTVEGQTYRTYRMGYQPPDAPPSTVWVDPDVGIVRIDWGTDAGHNTQLLLVGYAVGDKRVGQHDLEPETCAWTKRGKSLGLRGPFKVERVAMAPREGDDAHHDLVVEGEAGGRIGASTWPRWKAIRLKLFKTEDGDYVVAEGVLDDEAGERKSAAFRVLFFSETEAPQVTELDFPMGPKDKLKASLIQRRNVCLLQLRHRLSKKVLKVAEYELQGAELKRAGGSLAVTPRTRPLAELVK